MNGKISVKEYKDMLNGTRTASPIRSYNPTTEIYRSLVQTIQHIQTTNPDMLSRGDVEMSIKVRGKTQSDLDNIYKGIADSLQGFAYENDKQIRKGSFERD